VPYQRTIVRQALRFADAEHAFGDFDVDAVLRCGVQQVPAVLRRAWYDEVRSSKRRQRHELDGAASSSTAGLVAVFRVADEFERLALRCAQARVCGLLDAKGLHVVDAFRAFNASRTGELTCGELWGGLEWLGMADLVAGQIHELVRLVDADADGFLSLAEFRCAFGGGDDDEPRAAAAGAACGLPPAIAPKAIAELHSAAAPHDAAQQSRLRSLTSDRIGKIKIKGQEQRSLQSVWSSRGVGAHTDCGIWAPVVALGLHQQNRLRLCVGHYATKGLGEPSRSAARQTLEVTDLGVLHLGAVGASSAHLEVVVAQLFPPPLRWRQVWNTLGKRIETHFFAWQAVAPPDFVALGMVGTATDEPPPLAALRCVPKRWCKPSAAAPKLVWDDAGTGGRRGSLWAVGPFGLLFATHGDAPPQKDDVWELSSTRFVLGDRASSNLWLPPELAGTAAADGAAAQTA